LTTKPVTYVTALFESLVAIPCPKSKGIRLCEGDEAKKEVAFQHVSEDDDLGVHEAK
jgi:hypothetical protein